MARMVHEEKDVLIPGLGSARFEAAVRVGLYSSKDPVWISPKVVKAEG